MIYFVGVLLFVVVSGLLVVVVCSLLFWAGWSFICVFSCCFELFVFVCCLLFVLLFVSLCVDICSFYIYIYVYLVLFCFQTLFHLSSTLLLPTSY